MRTSTGSISVTKIIQNTSCRPGKRKYTTANALSSEIAILPMAITSALIRLTVSIGATGVILLPYSVVPPKSARR